MHYYWCVFWIFLAILIHDVAFQLHTCASGTEIAVFVFVWIQSLWWWPCKGRNMWEGRHNWRMVIYNWLCNLFYQVLYIQSNTRDMGYIKHTPSLSLYTHARTHIFDAKRSDPYVLWCDAVSSDLFFPTFRHTPEYLMSSSTLAKISNLAA